MRKTDIKHEEGSDLVGELLSFSADGFNGELCKRRRTLLLIII